MSILILLLILACLFTLNFLTKRRFGVLGLALAAGSVISAHWAASLTPFLQQHGIGLASPPLGVVVQALLILAPAVLLLFSGPAYSKTAPRVVGSLAFTVLALAFLLAPLGSYVKVDSAGQGVYSFFRDYQGILVVGGLALALADILFTRKHKSSKRSH